MWKRGLENVGVVSRGCSVAAGYIQEGCIRDEERASTARADVRQKRERKGKVGALRSE